MSRGRLAQWKTVRFVKFVRGDRGSIPAEDYVSDAIFSSKEKNASHKCLTENPTSDGFFQSRNLDSKAVAASPLSEEERNLEKWPMTSSDVW